MTISLEKRWEENVILNIKRDCVKVMRVNGQIAKQFDGENS